MLRSILLDAQMYKLIIANGDLSIINQLEKLAKNEKKHTNSNDYLKDKMMFYHTFL